MSTLYIVATPIGNLEDVTLRALRVLKEVDVIFCEDTRVTKKLLSHYDIDTQTRRLDAHLEETRAKEVVNLLATGSRVAYVTDAGTPGISDPGHRLVGVVRQALGDSFPVESIPGPSAITAALSIAGVPADEFIFKGFLPHKKGRQTQLKALAETKSVVVLYESPHRIMRLLGELEANIGDREIVVLRELTKKFEEVQVGRAGEIREYFESEGVPKGEFVVIISPK